MAGEVAERRSGQGNVVTRFFDGVRYIPTFYNEVVAEMAKVTWPDRAQLKDTTIKLIIFVLFIGAVIGAIDLVMQLVLVQGLPSLFSGK
jgi:preprotein translocase subunit SecE